MSDSEDLIERLGQLATTADEAGRATIDGGRALVLALTDQLAAGQSEVLYGMHSASSELSKRSRDLEEMAARLPADIAERVAVLTQALSEALAQQAAQAVDAAASRLDGVVDGAERLEQVAFGLPEKIAGLSVERITGALDTASVRLGVAVESVQRELQQSQEHYLRVLRESAEATGALLSDELEAAAKTVIDSASRAKASQTVLRAAAAAGVEALQEAAATASRELLELQDQLVGVVEQATSSFSEAAEALAAEGAAVTQGLTAVAEGFINRLFDVLDERDSREQALEQRFADQVDHWMQSTEDRFSHLAAVLDDRLQRVEAQAQAERSGTAAELHALVDRLLGQPRGRLRELRSATKTAPPPPAVPAAPARSFAAPPPPVQRAEPAGPVAPPVARKAPAARTPAAKPPAKRAAAQKATAAKAPAKKAAVANASAQRAPAKRAAVPKAPVKKAPVRRPRTTTKDEDR